MFKVLTIVSIVGIPPTLMAGNLWHELQEHAGIRLGLGLPIWLGGDRPQRPHSSCLVLRSKGGSRRPFGEHRKPG